MYSHDQKTTAAFAWFREGERVILKAVFILGLLGGEVPPPKISDSPPKVVSDLVIAIHYISFSFTKNALKFNLRGTNMLNFLPWL